MFYQDISQQKPAAHISKKIDHRGNAIALKQAMLRFFQQQARHAKHASLEPDNHRHRKLQQTQNQEYQRHSRRNDKTWKPANALDKMSCIQEVIRNTEI